MAERTFSSSAATRSCCCFTRRLALSTFTAARCSSAALLLLKSLQIRARGRERRLVLRDFVLRRRPLGDQLRQRLLRSFEVGNLCFSFLQIPSQLRYVVRRPTGVSVAQFGLRRQQIRASLRKLRALIRGIQSQNQLAFAYGLPFASFHVRDETWEIERAQPSAKSAPPCRCR